MFQFYFQNRNIKTEGKQYSGYCLDEVIILYDEFIKKQNSRAVCKFDVLLTNAEAR